MKVTILYDNTVFQSGLVSDWGFSCLVETQNRTILFDTGSNGSLLLENMKKLGIDPLIIQDVFISHPHFDHIGGLSAFLDKNDNVTVYVPVSLKGIKDAKKVVSVDGPKELYENIYSTGELDHIEQSMVVKTYKGLVIFVGCSHPKMKKILKAASQFGRVYAVIGGLHGFNKFKLFRDLGVICPTHCTQHIKEIKDIYPQKFMDGGVGKIITNKELGML
jgi:7,8-dihydropterin-6-yl-methyl-4-(beta-D-ribofuranosyl)aminobenzene 5'-phosphate synthase